MAHFLKDQVSLVTGGTQGIGWAITQALAAHGAEVYACGRSRQNLERAEEARAHLAYGSAIHLAQRDITERMAYTAWIEEVYRQSGRLDILVNNAAYVRWVDVEQMSVEEAERTMRVAYDGMVYGIKAVLPHMLDRGQGQIVNIGSIAGSIFVGGASAAYAAAKAAVEAYTRTLQVELRASPVKVTLVRLGTVAGTDFFKKHVSYRRMPRLLDFLPYTTPPRVAEAIVAAIGDGQEIVTLPRYLTLLRLLYLVAPRFSLWVATRGGRGRRRYASPGGPG